MTSTSVNPAESGVEPISVIVVSDFVCPWCYVGLTEVERLEREYPVLVSWAPYLLDPSVPPEGRVTEPRQQPGDPLSPVEQRALEAGLHFARGRTFRPNSHLALEAGLYAQEQEFERAEELHHALYRAHFETLEDIGKLEVLVRLGAEAGMDAEALRAALTSRQYEAAVDEEIALMRQIGVTAVPTIIFNQQYAIVGAQPYEAFQQMMSQLGYPPPAATAR